MPNDRETPDSAAAPTDEQERALRTEALRMFAAGEVMDSNSAAAALFAREVAQKKARDVTRNTAESSWADALAVRVDADWEKWQAFALSADEPLAVATLPPTGPAPA